MSEFVLNVNGKNYKLSAPDEETLLSVLRNRLDLTGTKYGCGEGRCGACTVLLDGRPTRSCVTPVRATAGKQVRTIEGLATGEQLHPVQQAFLDAGAMQCSYCTSGMIMSATALLHDNHKPSEQQILAAMNGNVCRCGTYPRIVAAIQEAARAMQGGAQ